ncbi:uncharacterized protein LOC143891138 [Tasmannia lanceolata]|uniref:uncharacterized protein LOC143891138 n=1 Tax=Tasmannia lanceolata TaxID=3420 RepID=UPI0040637A29
MDMTLLAGMMIQITEGNRGMNGFNDVFNNVVIHLKNDHNLHLNISQIKKRLGTLKKNYKQVKALLEHSGFVWDSTSKMISICNELCIAHITFHLEDLRKLTEQHDLFDESLVVFGDNYATRQWARSRGSRD